MILALKVTRSVCYVFMKSTLRKETVFVGLSGGVDSSVAALRLKKQGYTVVGVFIKVWSPDFLECNWEQERLDAMRVASLLDIPFLTCDAAETYKNEVAKYFIDEYTKGKTPNPDVMCNKQIKFGAFLKFAKEHNATYIATGHYASKEKNKNVFELQRGRDTHKDQSYFLWTLTQEQLASVLLPIGDSNKETIRKEAYNAGLLTAQKKDSQGICFLGQVDIAQFLSHYIELQKGTVLNTHGEKIGTHKGALVYTTGQRHGFEISERNAQRTPYYIVERNIKENTITVATKEMSHKTILHTITLTEVNYIGWEPKQNDEVSFQTRYRQKPQTGIITDCSKTSLSIKLHQSEEYATEGQSCVLYDGERCLGGGIIT